MSDDSLMRTYEVYRHVNLGWLDRLPSGWGDLPLRRLGKLSAGAGFPHSHQGLQEQELPFFKVADMNTFENSTWMSLAKNSVSRSSAKSLGAGVFPRGAIVFPKVGAALLGNKRRLLAQPSCVDNNIMVFIPFAGEPRYFLRALEQIDLGQIANPGAVPSVNEAQVGQIALPVPSGLEQTAIADFLDRETAKIDALIDQKQRLIELLEEKRSALITQAVTKGLDNSAESKDSELSWLGRIPSHWTTAKLGRLTESVSGGTPDRGNREFWKGEVPWVSPKDMKVRKVGDSMERVSARALRETGLKLIPPNAVLMVVRGMILDHTAPVAKTTTAVTINQDMKALLCRSSIQPTFLTWALEGLSGELLARVDRAAHGTCKLNTSSWKGLELALPPLNEQRRISGFLEPAIPMFDDCSARIQASIDLLREYRTALISAAVTGKIDVRRTAA